MIEWTLTSSALIAAVLLLRRVFKGRISPVVQYALWGLVLVRLLLPVNIGETALSVANLGQELSQQRAVVELQETTVAQPTYEEAYERVEQRYEAQGIYVARLRPEERAEFEGQVAEEQQGITLGELLPKLAGGVWLAGVVLVGGVFLWSNLRFGRRLKADRERLDCADSPVPVYRSAAVDTPCLFGLIGPAIYVTEQAAADATVLRHTLVHENVHRSHGDHLWSVLRCVCLTLHWYNPLVWWAAAVSRRDGELACDQSTIKRLGEEERACYGRTLIAMTCQKRPDLFVAATTVTTGKGDLRERILLIAQKPRMAACTLCVVLVIAAVCVGCTFTGGTGNGASDPTEKYGQTVFPEGVMTNVLVQLSSGEEVQVTAGQLVEMTAWLSTFTYGDQVELDNEVPGEVCVTVIYADGTSHSSGVYRTEMDGARYQVCREDVPECWKEILAGNSTQTEDTVEQVRFRTNVLYDQSVPGRLNLVVMPTEVGKECYFVPMYYMEMEKAMDKAVETATELEGYLANSGMSVYWNKEYWRITQDGALATWERYIAPEDAAEVLRLCQDPIRLMALGEAVTPDRLDEIEQAWLELDGTVYILEDRAKLRRLADRMSGAEESGGSECTFGGLLTMKLGDGSYVTVNLATDGCGVWLSEGRFFSCDVEGESLYALFDGAQAQEGGMIVSKAELAEGDFSLLTLKGVTVAAQDEPTCWALREGDPDELQLYAERGAAAILGKTHWEEPISYWSSTEWTDQGEFLTSIKVNEGELSYLAMWTDEEKTPYYEDPAVSEEEAIALAEELIAAFGLEGWIEGKTRAVEWDGEKRCLIDWSAAYDGLDAPGGELRVEVIGDDAVSLQMKGFAVEPVTEQEGPGYFLSLEEALYCVNYARSLAPEDSVFEATPHLKSVGLIWTNRFACSSYTTVDYTPAYAFEFVSESGRLSYTVLVDAYSGVVSTQTKEGDYPSPYIFVGK